MHKTTLGRSILMYIMAVTILGALPAMLSLPPHLPGTVQSFMGVDGLSL